MARRAGILLLVALMLAPRVRIAYFVFPLNLLLWAGLLRGEREPVRPRREGRTIAVAATSDQA